MSVSVHRVPGTRLGGTCSTFDLPLSDPVAEPVWPTERDNAAGHTPCAFFHPARSIGRRTHSSSNLLSDRFSRFWGGDKVVADARTLKDSVLGDAHGLRAQVVVWRPPSSVGIGCRRVGKHPRGARAISLERSFPRPRDDVM